MNGGAERSSWQRRRVRAVKVGAGYGNESRKWTVESDGQHNTAITSMRWAWKWKALVPLDEHSPGARCS